MAKPVVSWRWICASAFAMAVACASSADHDEDGDGGDSGGAGGTRSGGAAGTASGNAGASGNASGGRAGAGATGGAGGTAGTAAASGNGGASSGAGGAGGRAGSASGGTDMGGGDAGGEGPGPCEVPVNGPFLPVTPLTTDTEPVVVESADFNGDMLADLAVGCVADSALNVFLGNGDGTFQRPDRFEIPYGISSLSPGDFNGDRIPDLAIGNSAEVGVVLRTSTGTFQVPTAYQPSSEETISMHAVDFNRDGNLDVAVGCSFRSGEISVHLGSGNGSLGGATPYMIHASPQSLAVADFDRDGVLDVAATGREFNSVGVMLGNGDGTFTTGGGVILEGVDDTFGPQVLVAGDFTGDGRPDLVIAYNDFSSAEPLLELLTGRGDGTFDTSPTPIDIGDPGSVPFAMTAADLNGDARPDLAVALSSGVVRVLASLGGGRFRDDGSAVVGTNPRWVSAADLNGDERLDLAVANSDSESVSILLNAGCADGT